MAKVIYKGKKFKVKDGWRLFIYEKDIKHISEIQGLETFTNLSWLSLNKNQITEIKGLETLTSLRTLSLENNKITEIKGLETLTDLLYIHLSVNQITEIKGLERLTKLYTVSLGQNQITEIKGLEKLTRLLTLSLGNNQITEIKGLENLPNLQELYLYNNQITEIKGLEKLPNLQKLRLDNNQITEIKGLEKLTKLKSLTLDKNNLPETLLEELGGLDKYGRAKSPQKFVEYCQNKKRKGKIIEEKPEIKGLETKYILYVYDKNQYSMNQAKNYIEQNKYNIIKSLDLSNDLIRGIKMQTYGVDGLNRTQEDIQECAIGFVKASGSFTQMNMGVSIDHDVGYFIDLTLS